MSTDYLIVANQTLGGPEFTERIRYYVDSQPDTHVHVLVPATQPEGDTATPAEAQAAAEARLAIELGRIRTVMAEERAKHPSLGELTVTGEVGPEDPFEAIREVIDRDPPYREVVISTLPGATSGWLRRDLPSRVESKLGVTVVHIEARA